MKKYGILLLTIVCLTATLTWVSAAETGAPAPSPAPAVTPSPAPMVENGKPETMIQKAENALEKTEEKIKDAAEKVKEKAEEIIEGEKAEPVKAEEEIKPEEPAGMEEGAEEKAEEKADEKAEENEEENDAEDSEDAPSDEEEIIVAEETMDAPEIMPEDALIRACILHWLCHLGQHAHCWGPSCFFGHSDASSPIRREKSIEEMLPNYCIGVLTSPVPEALGTHFGLRPYEGLWVEHVIPGSPAAEAGIRRGDILLRAIIHDEENGEKIKKVFWLNHPVLLMDLVEQIGPEEIELTTICSGKEQKINLKPTERKDLMEKAGLCI